MGSSRRGSAGMNPTSIHKDTGQVRSLALLSGLRIWHCWKLCVGQRHSLDPTLLWLWYRLASVALIQLLTWELPYATGVALKRPKKKKKKCTNRVIEKGLLWSRGFTTAAKVQSPVWELRSYPTSSCCTLAQKQNRRHYQGSFNDP